ncbi:MAG: hypothetical protein KDA77_01620 [Planctomycetaceae bacterium]|nr:hypothetical protein [Planctomycetaceae bacterium]
MNDQPSFEGEQDPELVKIDLGDIGGNDEELKSKNERLTELIKEDASKPISSRIIELLVLIKSPGLFVSYKILESTYNWIKKRLTEQVLNEVNIEQRQAEAELTRSEANKNRAAATAIRKESASKVELQQAQAEAIRTENQLKLISYFKENSIEWQAEYDNFGHMHIVVIKRQRLENEEEA